MPDLDLNECGLCGRELYRLNYCSDAIACVERAAETFDGFDPPDDYVSKEESDAMADRAADRYERALYGD